MEQLKVIGTEDDVLVLATDSGERFSLSVDDVLRIELRKARRERESEPPANRPSPREIQSHIRAGLSAQEVAALLGARVEDVARFEGPVLAEREHVVGQALAVPVLLGGDLGGRPPPDVRLGGPQKARGGRRRRRAVDELERADRLDREARIHRRGCRPRCALELRAAAQHPVAAQRGCDPAVTAGLAS